MMKKNKRLVPKRRFKEFENDREWEQRKLGELSTIVRGASPRPIQNPKWFDSNSDVGWLRIADVTKQDGRIFYLDQKLSEAGQEKTRVLKTPHLLVSIAATVGKPVINYVNTGVHDGFLIFLNPNFDQEFMFQWLEMFREKWQKYGQPGSQVNLNSDLVRNQDIVIPTIKEQQKIGSYFEELDRMLNLQQQKLKKIETLKKSYLLEMFPKEGEKYPKKRFEGFTEPWKKRRLNEIANYLTSSLSAENSLSKGQYRLYDANGMIGYAKNGHQEVYISIIKDGSGVGRVRLLPKNSSFIGTMGGILNRNESDINYLYAFLQKFDFTNYIIGATIPHVYFRDYGESPNYHPGIEEQIKIGNFFKNLDAQIDLEERKLNKLEQLKKAYLNELFV